MLPMHMVKAGENTPIDPDIESDQFDHPRYAAIAQRNDETNRASGKGTAQLANAAEKQKRFSGKEMPLATHVHTATIRRTSQVLLKYSKVALRCEI